MHTSIDSNFCHFVHQGDQIYDFRGSPIDMPKARSGVPENKPAAGSAEFRVFLVDQIWVIRKRRKFELLERELVVVPSM